MSSLVLFHCARSGPSRGALLAARAVGVPFKIQDVELTRKEQLHPEFVKINPQHTVPTLKDGDFVLWDSHAIAGYLVHMYGKDDKLYPRNPRQKAVVDQRLYFDIGTLQARLRNMNFPVMFLGETTIPEEKKKSLDEALGWMDIFLTDQPWLAGANMTIADCSCAANVASTIACGFNVKKHKKTYEWFQKCKNEMPNFDENLEGAELYGQYVKSRLAPNQF